MKYNRKWISLGIALIILLAFSSIWSVQAMEEKEMEPSSRELVDGNEPELDANHTIVIQSIMDYIEQHVNQDLFASLHIDRDEKEIGIIVLSFTQELSEIDKQAIEKLAEESAEVRFRVVDFSERDLLEKQSEIDLNLNRFEDQGITIYHTGVNVFINRVEIGISPFTEENAQILYNYFGDEKIHVVEGHEIQLLTGIGLEEINADDIQLVTLEEEKKDLNFFQRVVQAVKDFFSNLF